MAVSTETRGKFSQSALFRVGLLLLVFIVLFLIARQLAVPKSFGEFGYYRGDNLNEWAAMSANYASKEACQTCHANKVKTSNSSVQHTQLNCQACHGPAQAHTQDPFKTKPEKPAANAALCASCHADINGRSNELIRTVKVEQHSGAIACGQCHNPHQPLPIGSN